MDLLELLAIAFFVLLPLIQQFWAGRGEQEPPTREEAQNAGWQAEEAAAATATAPEADVRPEAAEWEDEDRSSWREAERITAGGVTDEEQAAALARLQERLEPETVPEALRVSSPVYSMEALHVDRVAERERFRDQLDAGATLPTRRASTPRMAALLRHSDDVRRGVLLAEVLGPPRGLR